MAKIVCVLYDDPIDGHPKSYPRDSMPKIERYPGGQTAPSPQGPRFQARRAARQRLGRPRPAQVPRSQRPHFVVTSDKDGPNSVLERELVDADVVISQPFWPAYLTAERIAKAKNLKLAITAGIGSDHVDLQAANARGITVTEVTYSNTISVSEHVVMMILGLVRNYIPSYQWVVKGGWNIADCAARSYDVEGMHVERSRPAESASRCCAALNLSTCTPLLRQASPTGSGGEGARSDFPPHGGGYGPGLRRGDHQRALAPRDRAPVQRRPAWPR